MRSDYRSLSFQRLIHHTIETNRFGRSSVSSLVTHKSYDIGLKSWFHVDFLGIFST